MHDGPRIDLYAVGVSFDSHGAWGVLVSWCLGVENKRAIGEAFSLFFFCG